MIRDKEYNRDLLISLLKNDEFKRNGLVFNFLKILNSIEHNTYIALNGRWGSGKTIFVKQIELLNEPNNEFIDNRYVNEFVKNYDVFYYNAWVNDYFEDPLESLLLNLISKRDLSDKVLEGIKNIIIGLSKNSIKKISGGCIDFDDIKVSDFRELLSKSIILEKRKEAVVKVISEIKTKKQFLIILDELDRCNPAFAVRLLETIKHYFDNDDLVFLISTNNHILAQTVKKFYGDEFDGEGYLDKFYDLRIDLPEIDIISYMTSKEQGDYCDIAKYFDMSLREANRFCSLLSIYNIKRCKMYKIDPGMIILPFALALKVKKPYDFDRFINGDSNLLEDYLKRYKIEKESKETLRTYNEIIHGNDSYSVFVDTAYLINVTDPIDNKK